MKVEGTSGYISKLGLVREYVEAKTSKKHIMVLLSFNDMENPELDQYCFMKQTMFKKIATNIEERGERLEEVEMEKLIIDRLIPANRLTASNTTLIVSDGYLVIKENNLGKEDDTDLVRKLEEKFKKLPEAEVIKASNPKPRTKSF